MTAIGMSLVYGGYVGVLWGVALIQGKNLGIKTLFSSAWPPDVPSAPSKSTPSGSTPAGSSSGANIYPTPTGTQSSTGSDLGI